MCVQILFDILICEMKLRQNATSSPRHKLNALVCNERIWERMNQKGGAWLHTFFLIRMLQLSIYLFNYYCYYYLEVLLVKICVDFHLQHLQSLEQQNSCKCPMNYAQSIWLVDICKPLVIMKMLSIDFQFRWTMNVEHKHGIREISKFPSF